MYTTCALLLCMLAWTEAIIVKTQYGDIEGKTIPLGTDSAIHRFHSVPYAKPPVGKRRWQVSKFI